MKKYFYQLADFSFDKVEAEEFLLINFAGESSDFVRFNHNKVRQSGNVVEFGLSLALVKGSIHSSCSLTLSLDLKQDQDLIVEKISELRETLAVLPEDPHFFYSKEICSNEEVRENLLVSSELMVQNIIEQGEGLDLVGILAAGGIYRGFANSIGQKNWSENYTFNFDWSVYLKADKAIKSSYAGAKWDLSELSSKMQQMREYLLIIAKPPVTIKPGKYNAYMAPAALSEIFGLLTWGGFSEKAAQTKGSPLLRLIEGENHFSESLNVFDHKKEGIEPSFDSLGFVVADQVSLVKAGRYSSNLISPRTAKEYKLEANSGSEHPNSLDVSAGELKQSEILEKIGTGLYINNLWYLNYSDRSACRMTGMTRFATLWVEDGELKGPVDVMRFDDSAFKLFGEKLVGLTEDREFVFSSATYGGRSLGTEHLPGAVVKDMNFSL